MIVPFVGGYYSDPILRADAQSVWNMYPETDKSGTGKQQRILVGTPGTKLFTTMPNAPIRGIWIGENRMFVVAGSKLYEVFDDGTSTIRPGGGDVGNDGNPVQIVPNGNQLAIVSAGYVYYDNGAGPVQATFPAATGTCNVFGVMVYSQVGWLSGDQFDNTMVGRAISIGGTSYGTVQQVVSPTLIYVTGYVSGTLTTGNFSIAGGAVPASCGTYNDGYAIVSVPSSAQFNISGLYDFTSWDPLDFAVKEGYPDHIAAVIADQANLYLLGYQTAEIWHDTGDADFPFQRIPGEVLSVGCAAPYSPDRLPDGIAFLGTDFRGGPMAFLIQGYQYSRISTPPIEAVWAKYSTVGDAVGYCYLDGGHSFYVLSFRNANATWVYDRTEDAWHQRSYGAAPGPRVDGYLHGYVWGNHYTGDHTSGNIYTMSRDYYDDHGTPIVRQRTASHVANENKRVFYSQFTLDVQTGEIATPTYILDWSEDGGNTWSNQHPRTPAEAIAGYYKARYNWRRLGHSRVRTFRVTGSDACRQCWIGSYAEVIQSND